METCSWVRPGIGVAILSELNAAQQTLSKAREQAIRNNYPYFNIITSTPNGSYGVGEWFYKRWNGSVESDNLFDFNEEKNKEEWTTKLNIDQEVKRSDKNTFVRVKYHWSEDPNKDQQWYQEQCQELDDERKINQELDLVFVGSSNCIFSDKMLNSFKSTQRIKQLVTPNGATLEIFGQIDPTDYYIIGCDTAESMDGAFCAIEVFGFREFNQLAELQNRYGQYHAFASDIDFIFQWLYKLVGGRIILSVENNTIGKAPIEILRFNTDPAIKKDPNFNYDPFLYKDQYPNEKFKPENKKSTKDINTYGIKTTGLSKQHMIGCLIEALTENPDGVKSQLLINQLGTIERTQSGTIRSSGYTDIFMSACFCAYTRNKKAIEIMPLLNRTSEELNTEMFNNIKTIASLSDPKQLDKVPADQGVLVLGEEMPYSDLTPDDDIHSFFPMFDS
jgi:hypothetical protein